jgi:uncharacterized protein YegL
MAKNLEDIIEIANPQQPHVATVLLIDTSGSMAGNIPQLKEGLAQFKEDVLKDDLARKRVDLAVISFNSDVQVIHDFSPIEDFDVPELMAMNSTKMGTGILKAIELIENRKKDYKTKNISFYRPWIFMITDGEPTDMQEEDDLWNTVIKAIHEGETNNKFLFFIVGVDNANMSILDKISPKNRKPIHMKDGHFNEMFLWLSRSQQKVSCSRVGEQVILENPVSEHGWGEISTN